MGGTASLAFFLIGKLVGNRVSAEDEIAGLDLPEMGVHGYSNDPGPAAGVAQEAGAAPEPVKARVPVPSM